MTTASSGTRGPAQRSGGRSDGIAISVGANHRNTPTADRRGRQCESEHLRLAKAMERERQTASSSEELTFY